MLSLEKNLGMSCPWNGPVAGSLKQPRGVKPRMLKTEDVVFVVVKREVVVDEEVVCGGVEDENEDEGLLVVETVEDDEDNVEDTVEDVLDVLSDAEDVELEDDALEVDELVDTSVEVELVDEDVSDDVEELISLVDDEDGTLAELELDVELVMLIAELLELDTAAGARLLYIDNLDRPPHYHHRLVFQFMFLFQGILTNSLRSPKHVKSHLFPVVEMTLPAAGLLPQ